MAFRILEQYPQYRDNAGNICAGGYLAFYETGTTTPKDVYGEPDLTPNNGPVIDLDASGRTDVDVWGDGVYRVRLYTADDVLVWSLDNVQGGDQAAAEVPDPATGDDGDALLTDGVDYYLAPIRQVPDPTGNAGEQLGTDGTLVFWEAKQTIPTYDADNLPGGVEQGATSFQIGNMLVQMGSGTANTNGTKRVTATVTFATAFTATPKVFVQPTVASVSVGGVNVAVAATGVSTIGFTANCYGGNEHGANDYNITTNVTFDYVAIGLVG